MNTTNNASMRSKQRNIGIDVGKDFLDVYIFELEAHWQVKNNATGKTIINQT